MKKEYQYLIVGALVSAAALMGMGNVGEEKQTTEGRYVFVSYSDLGSVNVNGTVDGRLFGVFDPQTGTMNYVSITSQTYVFPFAATKAEQSNGS